MKTAENKKKGFYDIEISFTQDPAKPFFDLNDIFYLRNLQQRKLFLSGEITDDSAEEIVANILQFNREDEDNGTEMGKRMPIKLYINSPGGLVTAGFSIIDAIVISETPVYTINTGVCYSMAFLVAICGAKRYAMESSTFLLHDGTIGFGDSQSKAEDIVDFNKRYNEDIVKKHVTTFTGISSAMYDEKKRVEWYMLAQDAKDMGVIDYLVGLDTPIYDII